jgi:CheY-like chemotaxis protein
MKHILVIDDEPSIGSLLTHLLTQHGYRVTVRTDGRQGVAALRHDPADLVITDIFMPEKDGMEVMMELKDEFQGLKIMIISGGGPMAQLDSAYNAARKLGIKHIFFKPFVLEELATAVREELA